MKVSINSGHDRKLDPGAVGFGLREADIVWNVGLLLKNYLEIAGVEVVGLVQDDDLNSVCRTANNSGADIFISIHCNSASNRQANGTETFCYGRGGKAELLAGCIQKQICDRFVHLTDRGVKTANFQVLRDTVMPAVLVELAFISNELNANLLRYDQDEFAKAIARGVTDYQLIIEANNE